MSRDTQAQGSNAKTRVSEGWWFALRMALVYLLRDWRSGELRVIALSLVIAVSAVSAVNFYTDRVERAMERQATSLLGGDVLVRRSRPLPNTIIEQARDEGLSATQLVQFPSVVLSEEEETQLVAVKAVGDGYPQRGALKIRDAFDLPPYTAQDIPEPGTVWVESRLLGLLDIEIGDQIYLGDRQFKTSALIDIEPDRGGFLFQLAPRVMLNLADLDSTGLVTEASRASYRVQFAGSAEAVDQFRNIIDSDTSGELDDVRIEDVRTGRPELRIALDRQGQFLGLVSIVCVLLAGAAVAVSAQGFAARQADASAVMRTFGATRQTVFRVTLARVALIAVCASVLGVVLGALVHSALVSYLARDMNFDIPAPGVVPAVFGLLTGMICLIGFALPSVLNVAKVPVLRVLRHELALPSVSGWLSIALAFTALCLLMVWQAGDVFLAMVIVLGVVAIVVMIGLIAVFTLWVLRYARIGIRPGWRFGASSLLRRPRNVVLQMTSFCVGMMALLLVAIVGGDILDAWRDEIPPDAPNYFAFNIQAQELDTARRVIGDVSSGDNLFYPMVRGRMIEINGEAVVASDYPDGSQAYRLLNRDYNMSFASEMRDDYVLEQGQWWAQDQIDEPLISIESSIATTYDLEIGDKVAFRIAGQRVEASIANVRVVDWNTFRPNFYVLGTPGWLAQQSPTYITSFKTGPDVDVTRELVKAMPGVTVIDLNALIDRIRGLIDAVSAAVEYVMMFTLLAGAVVLVATVQASRADRMRESALLKAVGANSGKLYQSLITEFTLLGAIAGLVAATVAGSVGWAVSRYLFELQYIPGAGLLLTGLFLGALGIGGCGYLVTRGVINQSPLQLLNDR
ncbi:MAG: FtsX-like permease family protein [Pseudomonadota bacterium]